VHLPCSLTAGSHRLPCSLPAEHAPPLRSGNAPNCHAESLPSPLTA
ncbi:uncharacterized protein METZ01_LOCUS128172, partial [marine metagenome]